MAAGASVVAASLLLVGPNPAPAAADKYGHSNNDYRKNGSKKSSSSQNRFGSNVVKDVIDGFNAVAGIAPGSKQDLEPPKMELGGSAGDVEELAMVQSLGPEGQMALRSAAVAEAPVGDNLAAAVPAPGGGSDYAGQAVSAFRAPRVTFGNGRTPGARTGQAPEAVFMQNSLPAPEAVPPAEPSGIEINIAPFPPPVPPIERIRSADLVVGQFGQGTTYTVTDPLAGVAGLILIPAIGAVLGYRQARAAQSLRESLRK